MTAHLFCFIINDKGFGVILYVYMLPFMPMLIEMSEEPVIEKMLFS